MTIVIFLSLVNYFKISLNHKFIFCHSLLGDYFFLCLQMSGQSFYKALVDSFRRRTMLFYSLMYSIFHRLRKRKHFRETIKPKKILSVCVLFFFFHLNKNILSWFIHRLHLRGKVALSFQILPGQKRLSIFIIFISFPCFLYCAFSFYSLISSIEFF